MQRKIKVKKTLRPGLRHESHTRRERIDARSYILFYGVLYSEFVSESSKSIVKNLLDKYNNTYVLMKQEKIVTVTFNKASICKSRKVRLYTID